ncbi:MAG: 4Fe-4S binding protein [Rickettsiales bacterium]|jgi:polyferredoxin|nr:4Fe-4S binding protein [Rickettsiales bacterium]
MLNRKFILRWAIRFIILALLTYQVIKTIDVKAISYTVIFIAPFLIGALACGWVCPAGLAQDLLFRRRFAINVPMPLHKWIRVLRYVFAALLITGLFSLPLMIQRGITGFVRFEFSAPLALWLAVASAVASIFINRFFCRYLCPLGAMSGVKSLARAATINRDEARCVKCGACDKVCPMKIAMSRTNSSCSPNCVDCFKCIESCPKKALYLGFRDYIKSFRDLFKKV